MFGLYFTILALVAALICKIQFHKDNIDWNRKAKENAERQGKEEFIMCDHDTFQNLKTGKMYKYRKDDNGDLWRVAQNGDKIENVSETKRKEIASKQTGSDFYVESVAYPANGTRLKRRRMNVQIAHKLIRVVDKRTEIDYFRVRAGSAYYYQNLDTAMFDYAEIVPEERGNNKVKLYVKLDIGHPTEVENTKENLDKSLKFLNEGREATIQKTMEWDRCSREEAIESAYGLWGSASVYDLYERSQKCSESVL